METELKTEEQREFCRLTCLKLANKIGWEITKNGEGWNKWVWVKLPLESQRNKIKSPYYYPDGWTQTNSAIYLHGDELNSDNWATLIKLIKYFGGDHIPFNFFDGVKYLNSLI